MTAACAGATRRAAALAAVTWWVSCSQDEDKDKMQQIVHEAVEGLLLLVHACLLPQGASSIQAANEQN